MSAKRGESQIAMGKAINNKTPAEIQASGCDGTFPLGRVLAVGFYIGDVVDNVNHAGYQTENDHTDNGVQHGIHIGQLPVEDDSGQ